MSNKIKQQKTDSDYRKQIFRKIGYSLGYQDFELDESGDEILDSEEGYYWIDAGINRTIYSILTTKMGVYRIA
jgi:hypothetical protein